MPKKPVCFGIKIWAAADAISKYLWNFEVYCGKHGNPCDDGMESDLDLEYGGSMAEEDLPSRTRNGLQGRNIVKDSMKDLGGRAHIVTMDNFFTSVPLYLDLLENGIMAMGTLRANRKYVPHAMYDKNITKKQSMGWMDYHMHEEEQFVVWFGRISKQCVFFPLMRSQFQKKAQSHLYIGK